MPGYLCPVSSDEEHYIALASRRSAKKKLSRYFGVKGRTPPAKSQFYVSFNYQGVRHYIGSFIDEKEAALAYNKAALEIVGPHAILNYFPDETDFLAATALSS